MEERCDTDSKREPSFGYLISLFLWYYRVNLINSPDKVDVDQMVR